MTTCIRCSASIPDGRKFCTAHYMEAISRYEQEMANYRAALVDYQDNLARWNALSPAERHQLDVSAEETSVSGYAGLLGLAVGGALWFVFDRSHGIDMWLGILLMVACVAISVIFGPLRTILGRLTRAALKSIVYFLVLLVIGWVASIFVPVIRENAAMLIIGLGIACLVLSAIAELSGGHHASAAPTPPKQPSRPSP